MKDQLPDEWVRSESTSHFFGCLASAPIALLMLDYDGTLAPFAADRLAAVPYPGVKERLERIAALPRSRVALISGRKAHELQDLLALQNRVEIWGSHGREHIAQDGSYRMQPLTPYERESLASVQRALESSIPPACIEVKPSSLAVHWRTPDGFATDTDTLGRTLQELYDALPRPRDEAGTLRLLQFDGGLELRAGLVNKGHAIEAILERFSPETPAAFLGDDITDEDAFAVLRHRGLAVLVREHPRPSLANLWLAPPRDLLVFLDAWSDAIGARH